MTVNENPVDQDSNVITPLSTLLWMMLTSKFFTFILDLQY